jgi:hypothetical protein
VILKVDPSGVGVIAVQCFVKIAAEKTYHQFDGLTTKTGHLQKVFQRFSRVRSTESSEVMERAMGIEPTATAR